MVVLAIIGTMLVRVGKSAQALSPQRRFGDEQRVRRADLQRRQVSMFVTPLPLPYVSGGFHRYELVGATSYVGLFAIQWSRTQ